MAALTEEVKLYIVQCLACYDTPSRVAESVEEEFGIKIDRSHVQKYDPTKAAGKDMKASLREVFQITRKAFLDESIQVPIASKIFRLRSLQRMHDYYVGKRNFVQAQAVLEQAAKEVGNVYTNKLQHGGDQENPFLAFLQHISGTALPVAHEVVDSDDDDDQPMTTPQIEKKKSWRRSGSD